jgi:hypothetical protein
MPLIVGIARRCGDQVLALKGNQGTRHDDVSKFLDDSACNATVVN